MQNQALQQVMDEAEKEYKKVSERITESREAMKVVGSLLHYHFKNMTKESNL